MTARRLDAPDLPPERSFNSDDIAAYGAATVEDLISEIAGEQGEGDEPVLMVNGELMQDAGELADYPAEAVERLDVLPRGSAVAAGGPAGRRVYNVVLRRRFLSESLSLGLRTSTAGGWSARSAALTHTRIQQQDRLNLSLRLRDESALLESERGVVQPATAYPYDVRGNIVPDPRGPGGEIDPRLSAIAGYPATVVGVPAGGGRGLADFASTPPNTTDVGRFRTLRPDSQSLEFSATGSKRLSPRLRASLDTRMNLDDSLYRFGLASGLALLPAANPFSPFARDVAIALSAADRPLTQRSRNLKASANLGLEAKLGRWQASLGGRYDFSRRRTRTSRQAFPADGALPAIPDRDPFAGAFGDLFPLSRDKADFTVSTAELRASLTGPLAELPAGPLRATLRTTARTSRTDTLAVNFGQGSERTLDRTEGEIQVSADVPIASRAKQALPYLGDLSANLQYSAARVARVGTLSQLTYGLIWSPWTRLNLTASRSDLERPPAVLQLGEAVVVTSGVRYFDVLRGETVDVTVITGGNPFLASERVRTDRLGAVVTLKHSLNLQLSADYSRTINRNSPGSLPATNAAVLAAFPERFVRDASGRLSSVDLRLINLARQRQEQFRWGFSLSAPLGAAPVSGDGSAKAAAAARRPKLTMSGSHAVYLASDILIRPGAPAIDLLRGGAFGFGGGRPRHQLNGSIGLAKGGSSATLSGVWRSESRMQTAAGGAGELRFAPLATFDLRIVIDPNAFAPRQGWAKGARLNVSVVNIGNSRQRVTDQTGATPLRFQPAYRDALGRTLEIVLRKSF